MNDQVTGTLHILNKLMDNNYIIHEGQQQQSNDVVDEHGQVDAGVHEQPSADQLEKTGWS